MFNKLLLISLAFSVSFPSLSMEFFNENEYYHDNNLDQNSLFGEDLEWGMPSNTNLLSFSSEIKYSQDEQEQFTVNSEHEPVLKKFKSGLPEGGGEKTESLIPEPQTSAVNITNYYNNTYNHNYYYGNRNPGPSGKLAANTLNTPEKLKNKKNGKPNPKKKGINARMAQENLISEDREFSLQIEKDDEHRREKGKIKILSRSPVLLATLSCVKEEEGASFIEDGKAIDVNDFTKLFKCIDGRCSKKTQTNDWRNREKTLRGQFSGIPLNPFDKKFKMTPLPGKEKNYNKIRNQADQVQLQ